MDPTGPAEAGEPEEAGDSDLLSSAVRKACTAAGPGAAPGPWGSGIPGHVSQGPRSSGVGAHRTPV